MIMMDEEKAGGGTAGGFQRFTTAIRQSIQSNGNNNSNDNSPRLLVGRANTLYDAINANYPDNTVTNTKYTWYNFIPKNLFEQFKRAMNRYFLGIACLQLIPEITPVNPLTTFGPLAVIFGISAVKELVDDRGRAAQDKVANGRKYQVVRNGQLQLVSSSEIMVGDVVQVKDQEEVPCDLCLLQSSAPNGICFLQTTNLDGETNLKTRQAVPETQSLEIHQVLNFSGAVICAQPNNSVYKFDSKLWVSFNQENVQNPPEEKAISISSSQLLQQTTTLRNVDYVYGLAVYTGNESKFSKNKDKPPLKWTKADQFVNKIAIYIFCFQLALVVFLGAVGIAREQRIFKKIWYLRFNSQGNEKWYTYTFIPLRFLLLNSTMIPISLKVTLDVAKLFYAKFIGWDAALYEASLEHEPARANNSAISEDLGQIQFVLSDKTGTLTQNSMVFQRAAIDDVAYVLLDEEEKTPQEKISSSVIGAIRSNKKKVVDLALNMVLNNGVQPTKRDDGSLQYRSSSPDEEALVRACAEVGMVFLSREGPQIEIQFNGQKKNYLFLQELEFNSDRKRMSVVVKDVQTGKMMLYIKGADDAVIARLAKNEDASKVSNHLGDFARQGLRTLVYGQRELSDDEFAKWKEIYHKAKTEIENREDAVNKACELLEHDFSLIGATAIEDKLQENVAETIQSLRDAGIRFWMLTGDKFDTAIQIGTSCQMRKPDGTITEITGKDVEEVHAKLRVTIPQVSKVQADGFDFCLVIRGEKLDLALDAFNQEMFIKLALQSNSVICCRFTPSQKAQIVKLVRSRGMMALAIGDGGNDVSMIQAANIGVGIRGKEGLQAARAADYQINFFRYLKRLILVHGHYSLKRTGFISEYSYYKSFLFCFCQIAYALYSGFSGNTLFNGASIAAYNMLLFFPIITFCLDKDLSSKSLMRNPQTYINAALGNEFNRSTFSLWIARAIYQGIIIFSFCISTYSSDFAFKNGSAAEYDTLANLTFFAYLWSQSLTLIIELTCITWWNLGVIAFFHLLSIVIMYASSLMQAFDSLNPHYGSKITLSDSSLWLNNLLIVFATLLPVIGFKYYRLNYRTTLIDKLHFHDVKTRQG